jgi:hypothetical protein
MKNDKPYAFISYQTDDKNVAGELKQILGGIGIDSFLAHDDIEVSQEWRDTILQKIKVCDIFICLLSKSYYESPWCLQESGIVAYRTGVTIIPLSLDGSIPKGFISHIQSAKLRFESISLIDLIPGLFRFNEKLGIDANITLVGLSGSFRLAENAFKMLLPHIDQLTESQAKKLLNVSKDNSQVHHAALCAREYLPPLLKKYGHTIEPDNLKFLEGVCAQYK